MNKDRLNFVLSHKSRSPDFRAEDAQCGQRVCPTPLDSVNPQQIYDTVHLTIWTKTNAN